jgi:hypothetical protein
MTTDRDRLAALLAHHADVLAARWRATDGPGSWVAASTLESHAAELTADEETPAVRELLDSILAFEAEHPAETTAPPAPADQAERRERYAAAISAGGFGQSLDELVTAAMTAADTEQAALRRERDLAIAHDRQPYPTAWAYEQACAALRRKTDAIERALAFAASLDDAAHKVAGADAVHPVAAHIRHQLDTTADEAQQAEPEEQDPTQLRWGLDDVMYGDDDTTTVMLSGPGGEPYWLELEPERTRALRDALDGPDFEEQT